MNSSSDNLQSVDWNEECILLSLWLIWKQLLVILLCVSPINEHTMCVHSVNYLTQFAAFMCTHEYFEFPTPFQCLLCMPFNSYKCTCRQCRLNIYWTYQLSNVNEVYHFLSAQLCSKSDQHLSFHVCIILLSYSRVVWTVDMVLVTSVCLYWEYHMHNKLSYILISPGFHPMGVGEVPPPLPPQKKKKNGREKREKGERETEREKDI